MSSAVSILHTVASDLLNHVEDLGSMLVRTWSLAVYSVGCLAAVVQRTGNTPSSPFSATDCADLVPVLPERFGRVCQ